MRERFRGMSNQVAVVAAISEHLGKEKHDALTKHIDLQVTYIDIQAFVDHKECGAKESLFNLFYFETAGLESAPTELGRFERDANIFLTRTMGDQNYGLNAFRSILSSSFYWSYCGSPPDHESRSRFVKDVKLTEDWENSLNTPSNSSQ
ncbi:hypothetical protein F5B18DRAFT_672378 [Nemania serpens]|nr:hypothetical protein F5B18DRAFT_672378 [Nemania serpens]